MNNVEIKMISRIDKNIKKLVVIKETEQFSSTKTKDAVIMCKTTIDFTKDLIKACPENDTLEGKLETLKKLLKEVRKIDAKVMYYNGLGPMKF